MPLKYKLEMSSIVTKTLWIIRLHDGSHGAITHEGTLIDETVFWHKSNATHAATTYAGKNGFTSVAVVIAPQKRQPNRKLIRTAAMKKDRPHA